VRLHVLPCLHLRFRLNQARKLERNESRRLYAKIVAELRTLFAQWALAPAAAAVA
jgi:hypothetical protein